MKKYLYSALVVVILVAVAYGVWQFNRSKSNIRITRSSHVVTQLKELQRYETASFTIETIIDAGTDYNAINQFLFGDRLLLIAHGEVVAGFDFSELDNKSVEIQDRAITVTLPAPQILITQLDSSKTSVYDREQGILALTNKDLESQARNEAENAIQKAACEGGILFEASDNARSQLTSLLKTLQFETVTINIPSATC